MKVYIFTNENLFLSIEAREIILPTKTGLMAVLENHIPLVTTLTPGIMLILDKEKNWFSLAVWRGSAFVEKQINFGFSTEFEKVVGELPKLYETFVLVLAIGIEFSKNLDPLITMEQYKDALVALQNSRTAEEKIRNLWSVKRCQVRYIATKTIVGKEKILTL
jgi:F0F1-type ATP synthase epsilon subunit